MKETAKHFGFLLLVGVIIATGMRLAEWLIPAPEARIVVCMANEDGATEVCKRLDDLIERKGG